jgi:hypothetical protein
MSDDWLIQEHACNALINKLVKKHNRTPLTYAGRAIGTVGTVTSGAPLKAHCLKGDIEKSLPTIYHIAKAALVQQTGGGTMPPSFPNLELIRTRTP